MPSCRNKNSSALISSPTITNLGLASSPSLSSLLPNSNASASNSVLPSAALLFLKPPWSNLTANSSLLTPPAIIPSSSGRSTKSLPETALLSSSMPAPSSASIPRAVTAHSQSTPQKPAMIPHANSLSTSRERTLSCLITTPDLTSAFPTATRASTLPTFTNSPSPVIRANRS